MTHIVFKPPSGDEAETTCESIWFLSSPRAPRQQQFVTTQGFRPSPPPPPPTQGPEEGGICEKPYPGIARELPGSSREILAKIPGSPPRLSGKSKGPPRNSQENFPGNSWEVLWKSRGVFPKQSSFYTTSDWETSDTAQFWRRGSDTLKHMFCCCFASSGAEEAHTCEHT